MLAVRLPQDLEDRLTELSQKTGRSKSHYARQAIIEWLEEYEETLLAVARLEKGGKRIPFEQLEKDLGLSD